MQRYDAPRDYKVHEKDDDATKNDSQNLLDASAGDAADSPNPFETDAREEEEEKEKAKSNSKSGR
jgi:hypothetical protein